MADVGLCVHTFLQTKSAITDLVSTRGYPANLPQKPTYPAYVYNTVATVEHSHLAGSGMTGVSTSRLQVDVYATTHLVAADVAEKIRLALLGERPITAAGVTLDKVRRDSAETSASEPVDGSDRWVYRVRTDYVVLNSEATS